MKLFFDFLPILLFFVAYKFYGVYIATAVAMAASAAQTGIFWLMHKRFEKMHVITLASVMLLGGATLLFHDPVFIKLKPTAIYWAFSLVFLGTQLFTEKTLIQRMMDEKIQLPIAIWNKLNISWIIFFALLGCLNLYVAYMFSLDTWVNFKLFGALGITIGFTIGQAIYMSKHAVENPS